MVGHRRTKGALLALVNWLLVRVERAEAEAAAYRAEPAVTFLDGAGDICMAAKTGADAAAEGKAG